MDTIKDLIEAYLHTALWSSTMDNGDPFDQHYGTDDFSAVAKKSAKEDLEKFFAANTADIEKFKIKTECIDPDVACDFWFTRCHHGVGFWDRKAGDVGERLTAAAQKFRELNVVVGDDGKLYLE